MTCSLTILLLAALTAANFFLGKKRVLYPAFLYCCAWCIDGALYDLNIIPVDRVHSVTWNVVFLGALVFSVGSWVTRYIPRGFFKIRLRELSHPTLSTTGRAVLITACVLAIPFQIRSAMSIGGGGFESISVNARQNVVDSVNQGASLNDNPLDSYLPLVCVWVTVICLIEERDKYFWIAFAATCASIFVSAGRSTFLLLFSALATISLIKTGNETIRGVMRIAMAPILAALALFVGFIFLTRDLSPFHGNLTLILATFTIGYVVGPIAALDHVFTHPAAYMSASNHTFKFFLTPLASIFGLSYVRPPLFDDFVFVPFGTNVYTIYKPLFIDFGYYGMFLAILVIGLFQTTVYRRAISGGRISLYFYSFLVFPTLVSIFDEQYSEFSLFILQLSLAFIYFGILNRITTPFSKIRFRSVLPRLNFRLVR